MTRYSLATTYHQGLRRIIGLAVTVVASLATIATTVEPEHPYVRLPDRVIALSQSVPQQQQRFRVETSTGTFRIEATLTMIQAVRPTLSISAIDGGSGVATNLTASTPLASADIASQQVQVELECNGDAGIPCTADLQALCGAQTLSTNVETGTLSVKVYLEGVSTSGKGGNGYVAIEPL